MLQKINASVSVLTNFQASTGKTIPRAILWNKRVHKVTKIGLHHTFREGRTLYHVFSVASKTIFFRLILNTENLHWKLDQIADSD